MSTDKQDAFFVGYLPTPAHLRLFLFGVTAFLVGGFAALALAIGVSQDDPGDGDFRWSWGPQEVVGRLDTLPYPMLHVTQGSKHIPAGNTLLLTGVGKRGVQARVAKLNGKLVRLKGIALKRGDIDALQVGGGAKNIVAVDGAVPTIATVPLGRWRLKGEICDGKCLAGAMRPGRGLSHRACANLCLIGGAPPVFVSGKPVDGSDFFLIGDADGKPLPERYLKHVSVYVSLDGHVERRGRMLVFKAALDTLEVQ
jgi:hypothetical protein